MTEETSGSSHVSVDDERTSPKGVRVSTMGWLSFFTMFVIGTDTFLVAPLLPLLQRELDVPLSRAGWLVSAYALGTRCSPSWPAPSRTVTTDVASFSPDWRPSPFSPAPADWPGASGVWSPPASWPA